MGPNMGPGILLPRLSVNDLRLSAKVGHSKPPSTRLLS